VYTSVSELVKAIDEYVAHHNKELKPFQTERNTTLATNSLDRSTLDTGMMSTSSFMSTLVALASCFCCFMLVPV